MRAFAASGLAAGRWTLVLKTKHLFDRPDEGRSLEKLVGDTPGTVLVNAAMASDEMAALLAGWRPGA